MITASNCNLKLLIVSRNTFEYSNYLHDLITLLTRNFTFKHKKRNWRNLYHWNYSTRHQSLWNFQCIQVVQYFIFQQLNFYSRELKNKNKAVSLALGHIRSFSSSKKRISNFTVFDDVGLTFSPYGRRTIWIINSTIVKARVIYAICND